MTEPDQPSPSPSLSSSAVVLAGGWMHPADDVVTAVEDLLGPRGFEISVVTEPGGVVPALDDGCDLLVVAACWFSMADDRYTPDQRQDWAVPAEPERERVMAALATGGTPVLALHTAVICFDGWEEWGIWLGGRWDWATSSHPPPGPVDVRPEVGSPVVVEPFTVVDEQYQGLVINPKSRIVARSGSGDPLIWVHEADGRRGAVSLLGHDRRSLDHPQHRAVLNRLVDWLVDPQSSPS